LSGVPHGTYAECFAHPDRDPIWQTVWTNRPQVRNRMIEIPRGAGFGIELDEKLVRRFRVN
jgi:L-alanine-DL-glutamate epimerase-like enolase superfamily enzyme